MHRFFIVLALAAGVSDASAQSTTPPPPAAARPAPASQKPVPQTPAQTPDQPIPVLPSDYRVGPQDVLNITVFGEPQLSGKARVDTDGTLSFQYLGRVKVDDLTVSQIEERLRAGLADGYLRSPQVSVEVDQYHSQNVYVLGEVKAAGKYSLPGNSTLIDVLTQAGSVTSNAGHWVLINHAKNGALTPSAAAMDDNATADIKVNLDDIQNGKAQNVKIKDLDTIYVPKVQRIYVIGQVRAPGAFPYDENMTVFEAISLAGGVTEKGSNTRISIRRLINGQMKEIDAKATDKLRANDQVNVKPRRL